MTALLASCWTMIAACSSDAVVESKAPVDARPTTHEGAEPSGAMMKKAALDNSSFCARARSADPTIKRCIDHDEVASQVSPLFGFDAVTTHVQDPLRIAELAPSPTKAGGQSLRLGFDSARVKHDVIAQIPAADSNEYAQATAMALDVDVTVDSMATSYAGLAMFELTGTANDSCLDTFGVAINGESFVRVEDPNGDPLLPFRMSDSYHLRIVAYPKESKTEIVINDHPTQTFHHLYSPACTAAQSVVGTFYAQGGTISARFDQLVIRVY